MSEGETLRVLPERPCKSALSFEFASVFGELDEIRPSADGTLLFIVPRGLVYDLAFLGVLAHRLRHEGKDVRFVLCDNLPACSQRDSRNHARDLCDSCVRTNIDFLHFSGFPYESIWDSIEPDDVREARERASCIELTDLPGVSFDDVPLGRLQEIALCRYLFRGSPDSSQETLSVARQFMYSGMILTRSFARILDRHDAEAILVANGKTSWASVATTLARERGIRTICYENNSPLSGCGEGKIWSFSSEGPIVDFPFVRAWETWRDERLTDEENAALDAYLESRKRGTRYYPDPCEELGDIQQELDWSPAGPVFTLCSNVGWDTMVLQKHPVFGSMFDWVCETIEAVRGTPVSLLVRVHPAEEGVDGFTTQESVEAEIRRRIPRLPDNVRLIPAGSAISTYSLIGVSDATLVYTSTMGLESTIAGKPAIVCSSPHYRDRGFTLDADSRAQYFAWLRNPTSIPPPSPEQVELARRYAYLFFFRQSIPFQVYGVRDLWNVSHYRISRAEEILPGQDPYLDLIVDGMIRGGDFIIPREENYFGLLRSDRLTGSSPVAGEAHVLLRLEAHCEGALEADPGNQEAASDLADVRTRLAAPGGLLEPRREDALHAARAAYRRGRVDKAIGILEGLLRHAPNQPVALEELARIYLDHRRPDEAEALLRRAVRVAPERESAWQWLVNVYRSKGDDDAAALVTQAWIDALPDSARALLQGAALVLERGDAANLRTILEDVYRLGGNVAAERWLRSMGFAPETAAEVREPAMRPLEPMLSVLLCSYNRAEKLRRCIDALASQTLARDQFEVILVNDGSTDDTREVMRRALSHLPGEYCEHETNRALAAARNTALRAARGRIVLFINDDTYPEPDMLEQHLRAHRMRSEGPVGVLGYISFDPKHERRVFSQALHHHDLLFPLTGSREGVEYDFDHFVTGNISVPRTLFAEQDIWFDESFLRYGCEDIEVGYRLWQKGLRVFYHPEARAIHDHRLTVRDYESRECHNAANLVQYLGMHPELVTHYLTIPGFTPELLAAWRREVARDTPGVADLISQIEKIEDVEVCPPNGGNVNLIGRKDSLVDVVAQGLRQLSGYCRKKTILETLDELPELRDRLVCSSGSARALAP